MVGLGEVHLFPCSDLLQMEVKHVKIVEVFVLSMHVFSCCSEFESAIQRWRNLAGVKLITLIIEILS